MYAVCTWIPLTRNMDKASLRSYCALFSKLGCIFEMAPHTCRKQKKKRGRIIWKIWKSSKIRNARVHPLEVSFPRGSLKFPNCICFSLSGDVSYFIFFVPIYFSVTEIRKFIKKQNMTFLSSYFCLVRV